MDTVSTVLPVNLRWHNGQLDISAFIDSGATGCFLERTLARQQGLSLTKLDIPLSGTALDGQTLGSGKVKQLTMPFQLRVLDYHVEFIQLHLVDSPELPLVLGHPWL